MRIVVAPDSFKGSATAIEVAQAMTDGLLRVFPRALIRQKPIADGGEGTVSSIVTATGGRILETVVQDPIGRPIKAAWGLLGDGTTAVVEMSAASGLYLLKPEERDVRRTSTFGTGELIRAALDRGVKRIILGLGGSATNDGGTGMALALGARFFDSAGSELSRGGAALAALDRIDVSGLDRRLGFLDLRVACDVDNPLCGPRGASHVYGPQKGATPEDVRVLDFALDHYAKIASACTGRSVADSPGAGAAGGLGAGLLFFTPATLCPGIDLVLEIIDFKAALNGTCLVITGEGRTDSQTAFGKAPVGVARLAHERGIPVICLSGGLGDGIDSLYDLGINVFHSVADGPMTVQHAMENVTWLIANAAERIARTLKIGGCLETTRPCVGRRSRTRRPVRASRPFLSGRKRESLGSRRTGVR